MTTLQQIEANRRNAQLSTGPHDTAQTRHNGRTHGLAGRGPDVPDDLAEARDAQLPALRLGFPPADACDGLLLAEAAAASGRLETCRRQQEARRRELRSRAESGWDDDRALWAAELFERL